MSKSGAPKSAPPFSPFKPSQKRRPLHGLTAGLVGQGQRACRQRGDQGVQLAVGSGVLLHTPRLPRLHRAHRAVSPKASARCAKPQDGVGLPLHVPSKPQEWALSIKDTAISLF